MDYLINIAQNFDTILNDYVNQYGNLSYLIAFLVVWIETGLIIFAAFLPGETLLFAAGAIAAIPENKLQIIPLIIIFFLAALLGDSTNYLVGKTIGQNLLKTQLGKRLIKSNQIEDTEKFFEKYGPSTIILGRYVPVIRALIPFVAAASKFSFGHFFRYSVIGAAGWSILITMIGYLFGNFPFVKDNFVLIIMGIVLFSLMPTIIGAYNSYKSNKKN